MELLGPIARPVAGQPLPPGWSYSTAAPQQQADAAAAPGFGQAGGPTPQQLAAEQAHAAANAGQTQRYALTAPAATQTMFQEGQTGIPFGGGRFQWTGTGWSDPTTGRSWDPVGNPVQPQQQPGQPPAPGPGLVAQQQAAHPLVDFFKNKSGINVNAYGFGKLKGSTQELVLGAAEAAGHDKADVLEDIQRTLPRATGPRRGYVAPLGTR